MKSNKKILFLADADSIHTYKWITKLSPYFHELHLFSLRPVTKYQYPKNVNLHTIKSDLSNESDVAKLQYVKQYKFLKKLVLHYNPDIIHSFYASSYGLLGALLKHPNYYISVWGSDVYDFPHRSFIHKNILRFNLSKAKMIFATSNALKNKAALYCNNSKEIAVVPFGVDTHIFKPLKDKNEKKNVFTFCTIKTLAKVYNIDKTIKAFSLFMKDKEKEKFRLLIGGEGPMKNDLKQLVSELNLQENVVFLGFIPQNEIPEKLAQADVFMVLSERESFGVAAVEASACAVPIIASNIEGLNEVVVNNYNGLLVNSNDIEEVVNAMNTLYSDDKLRHSLAQNGVELVKSKYDFNDNVQKMLSYYL